MAGANKKLQVKGFSSVGIRLALLTSLLLVNVACTKLVVEKEKTMGLNLKCEQFEWADVVTLVEPYLEDSLNVALVMQGVSSEYKVSEAASQAMASDLPKPIKLILKALIENEC